MITEVLGTSTRETFAVYFHKGILGEFSIWTVLLETFVPLTDCILHLTKEGKIILKEFWEFYSAKAETHLRVMCVVREEFYIFFRQSVL